MQQRIQSFFLFCFLLITATTPLNAATIELPLFLRTQILQNALVESLTPQPDRPTVLFQQGSHNYLHISEPQLTIRDGQPYFSCNAAAGMGFDSLGILPTEGKWKGYILMRLNFFVDPQYQLRYRIIDSAIYNEKGGKPVVTGFAWELSKRFLHPRLEQYRFDLAVPQKDITALLRACASPANTAALETALDTLTVGTLRANTDGITVPLLLTVTDALQQTAEPLPTQEPLSVEEMERLRKVFEPFDAFLVFIIKNLGTSTVDTLRQEELIDLLLASRYQLLMILAGQAPMETEDPLRLLFVDVWGQLRPIIESSSGEKGLMQKQLLRYMTFVNAGGALLILDKAAPGLGIHLTSDGLRRLARMLQPDTKEDPLRFDWEIDPTLRDLFKFQTEPVEKPQSETQTRTRGRHLFDFLVGAAHAASSPSPITPEQRKRLDSWVPSTGEMDEYGRIIDQLLKYSTQQQIKSAGLNPRFAAIYQHLVPATAMIESCWQQFERKDDKIVTLCSQVGSIGIMQINQHVWRGFYDIKRLQGDVAYNIQAGNQILMRYFKQHAIQVATENKNPEHAARAAYAAYNAGPRAVRRFMKADASARQKRIDDHLWELYQKAAAGGRGDVASCSIL